MPLSIGDKLGSYEILAPLGAGTPRLWSEKPIGGSLTIKSLDLAPDGKRMVVLLPASDAKGTPEAQNHVVFLLNFFDELRRKVPVGK